MKFNEMDTKELESILNYYNSFIGFELTFDQFKEIVEDNNFLKAEIENFGGHDTVTRELFMQALGEKITGKVWPDGLVSKEDTKQFFIEMKQKGPEMGYNIPNDYGSRFGA